MFDQIYLKVGKAILKSDESNTDIAQMQRKYQDREYLNKLSIDYNELASYFVSQVYDYLPFKIFHIFYISQWRFPALQ